MLRCQSISNSQSPHSGGSARLSHQTPMTQDRAGTITATMKEHQHVGRIAAGSDRPFSQHATDINRSELYVLCCRPHGTDIIETFASLGPSNRSRLGI